MFFKFKKLSLSIIIIAVFATSSIGALGFAKQAQAQALVGVVGDLPRTVDTILAKIWEGLKIGVLNVASVVVGYALRKIAYDSAVWIASGGKGEASLIYSKGFGDYIKDVGGDALGHGLDELGKTWGINLCKIPDPKVDLALRQSLRLGFGLGVKPTTDPGRKPDCSIYDFYQNNLTSAAWKSRWDNVQGSVQGQLNEALNFDLTQGDLGVQMTASESLLKSIYDAKESAYVDRVGSDIKRKVTAISGQTQLPKESVTKEVQGLVSNDERTKSAAQQIDTAIASGAWQNLPGAIANFFLNTLGSTLLKNFQEKGLLPFGLGCVGSKCPAEASQVANDYEAANTVLSGRKIAEAMFSDFITAKVRSVDQYNILGQLNNCPDIPGLYNCRADSSLVQAAQEFANGNPLTLRQAVERGLLNGDWKLLPPTRVAENANKSCFEGAYCYVNVKVLRQLRILPLGFEIAALESDPDKPWTLKEVIDGFDNCDYIKNNGQVVGINYDPLNKPFCHLVDPNWVIKSPPSRCNALVFGSSLLSKDVPNRMEECADLSTCVGYNKDGTCINYAYCTREKNVWNFSAETCDAQYRTCKVFTDENGGTNAYLYRTLDTGYCTKDNVGCRTYAFDKTPAGDWETPTGPDATNNYRNNGTFFNKTVSQSCTTQSAGCSAFKVANAPTNLLYLRQAPDYLQCYDSNPATAAIEYPKTPADLARIKPNTECKNYSGSCIADEVGCNWFTPVGSSAVARIPGKFDQENVCDTKCVGYAAYREMPNNYSNGQSIAYIIPSSGSPCTAEQEGCSAFTNLSTTSNGVEQVEYFSYLRSCSKPDPANQKNFVTYEGSIFGGFQLKTYTLIKDAQGGPKYFYRTLDDAKIYDSLCTEALYKAGTASPDCRQFNDESGTVYYRLLSKTIPVSESCTPYRLSTDENNLLPVTTDQAGCSAQKGLWSNGQCKVCFQGGEFRDGSCFYFGLPGDVTDTAGSSIGCSKEVETCRAYKGNNGNNVKEVYTNTFESESAVTEWQGAVSWALESTHAGEHSLQISGASDISKPFNLISGKSYEVSFWGKGGGQKLLLSLKSADGKFSKDFEAVAVNDTWKYYKVGPIEADGLTTTTVKLTIKNQVNGRSFIDNIDFKELSDYVYLVKKTLTVDPVCDSNPNDNLPGEALGCTAYQNPAQETVNLTGFNYLCRAQAIGCTALLNTYNTPTDEKAQAYNVWITGKEGTKADIKVGADVYSCQIPTAGTGCYVNILGHEASEILAVSPGAFVTSTIYVPSDTPTTSPLYLVANKEATCNAVDMGCKVAGSESGSAGTKYSTVVVKDDPATYKQTLCQAEAVGCGAYTSGAGSYYFKNPAVTGNKICEYKNNVVINGVKLEGWFWKGVGVCSNDRNKNCGADAECGTGNTCQDIGNQACYPNYVIDGNSFGLWSYGDKGKYQNFVGSCPAEQDTCTEFIDHNDSDKAYYLLNNDRISDGTCEGKVSQKEGCALFDQTDNPNKYWVTKLTYANSAGDQFKNVPPVAETDVTPGDANIIIQVKRDRECGEWIQCRSSHRVWDQDNARWKNVCDAIGRCNRTPENPEEDSISNCANWVEEDTIVAPEVLTEENYVKRDISWTGQDYSGYSILNTFPLETLSQINFAPTTSIPDWRLARLVPCGDTNCAAGVSKDDPICRVNDQPCGNRGSALCVRGNCVQGVNGVNQKVVEQAPKQICRGYPEVQSPFPNTPAIKKAGNQFANAKICSETRGPSSDTKLANACECDYTKAIFGDLYTKYFSVTKPNTTDPTVIPKSSGVPNGICVGGSHDGAACDSDNNCYKTKSGKPSDKNDDIVLVGGEKVTDGICQKIKRQDQIFGWRGFCLEQDLGRTINADPNQHPCLTWLPVDYLVGTQDLSNQHVEAGYQPPADLGGTGGRYYCVRGNSAGDPTTKAGIVYPNSHQFLARSSLSINTSDAGNNQFARKSVAPTNEESGIRQMDIEYIKLVVKNRDSEDPIRATTFYIWPNDPFQDQSKPQTYYETKDHDRGPGRAVTGNYLGKNNEFVLFYGSRVAEDKDPTYVDKDGNVCYPAAKYDGTGWEPDGTACQDLNGNIFKALGSRKGGGSYPGIAGQSRNAYLDPYTPGPMAFQVKAETDTDTVKDGIWDPKFNDNEICRSYSPVSNITDSQGNWHAVRIRFDVLSREFKGYDLAYCDQSRSGGGIEYEVTFKLKEWCSVVADVTNNPADPRENTSAWTNRLWVNTNPPFRFKDKDELGRITPALDYLYGLTFAPYGSLSLPRLSNGDEQVALTDFQHPTTDCINGTGLDKCDYAKSLQSLDNFQAERGAPYSCPGGNCVKVDDGKESHSSASGYIFSDGEYFLNQLFARTFRFFSWGTFPKDGGQLDGTGRLKDDRMAGYQDYITQPNDVTENANPIPKPPMIFPAVNCDANGRCIEDHTQTGVSINDIFDKDVIIPISSSRVFMRFYAFADADQMPLRGVTVDWGDGYKDPVLGMFRNHRGYEQPTCNKVTKQCEITTTDDSKPCRADAQCGAGGKCILQTADSIIGTAIGKCVTPQTTGKGCEVDSDCDELVGICQGKDTAKSFGHIQDQSCDNEYIQFTHVYQCTRLPRANGGNFEPDPAKCGPRFPNGCCIFQPKVQVKDNWGWCSGKCTDLTNGGGGDGCYDGIKVGKADECERSKGAWVPFGKRVIVTPPPIRR